MSKPTGNFLVHCAKISIIDESCIIGSSVLIISIIILVLNIYALFKMTKFYKKMNFENTIILLSIIQTIFLLQLVLISSYDIFFESFFLYIQFILKFLKAIIYINKIAFHIVNFKIFSNIFIFINNNSKNKREINEYIRNNSNVRKLLENKKEENFQKDEDYVKSL